MAAPQITSIPSSATFGRWQHYNSYSIAALQIQEVYDTFHSTKFVTHFTAQKSITHFIAQSLHVPAHQQSGQQSAHMHAAHRFLVIQIISNKLGVLMWRTVLRHLTLMYISQYPPPDIGNSFCVVVKMFCFEPKGLHFYPAAKIPLLYLKAVFH
ncbi:hypothetical protein AVEN_141655-1 [Araneus ventricosus]|uniref:Uncharacterized protein n=1 Tax=Araneus ventricosus TaxID=182803 RepID=A0A4Y2IQS0_ARAVE|nr:hypothetical protein AVEN_141655-1 [Araneus ventricosus]